ncbi:MAG TPA: TRAP transporter substrate-binding protein [Stellaceae bacterium]|jgi:TRAP-type C4-dicarboxylate transport system substrate-binding protein
MKRALALGALAMLLAAPARSARAAEPVQLKFGYPGSVSSYVNTKGMTPWLKAVNEASDGTLKITLYAGPTLGTIRDIYERTLAGVAQIAFATFGAITSQFPLVQVAELPFLSNDAEISSVALWRLYEKGLFGHEFDKVKVLALFNFESSALDTNKPVATIDDLRGLKLAVESRILGDMTVALGASPVTLTTTELYQAMSRGTVDGIFIGWTAIKTFKLQEVTKDHLELSLGEAPAYVIMNEAAYAALSAKAKAAIDKYSGESFSRKLGANNVAAGREEAQLVTGMAGQSVAKLSPAQETIWKARVEPIVDDWIKRTPDGAKVLAAYRDEIEKLASTR